VDDSSSVEGSSFLPQVAPSTEISNSSSFGMNEISNNPRLNSRLKQVLDLEKPRENPWQSAAIASSSQVNLSKEDSTESMKAVAAGSDRLSPSQDPDSGSISPRSGKSGSGGSGPRIASGLPPHQLQHKISALSAASGGRRGRATTVSSNNSSVGSSANGAGRHVRAR